LRFEWHRLAAAADVGTGCIAPDVVGNNPSSRRALRPGTTAGAIMTEAGEASPHLDQKEQRQAAAGAPMGALVIHEIVRDQGEEELERSFNGLAWSSVAAGLSIGFSFLAQATLQARLPDTPWRPLVSGFGYSIGFLIVILGRQQLFTETTLTAVIPALTRRDLRTTLLTLRVWAIVLTANIAATWGFAALAAQPGLFSEPTVQAMSDLAAHTVEGPFWHTVVAGGSAGWLIGLMVWLLPSADASRALIIILLTYVVAICQFPHIIAGSVEAAFSVFTGHATIGEYAFRFLVPTLLGNAAGGTILAALLNHAPLAGELSDPRAGV
jgi:formate/nitrite transporter FocA (FNT family)